MITNTDVPPKRQERLWSPTETAAIGESLERLATWCDGRKNMTFSLSRTLTSRTLRRGAIDFQRGYAIDVRQRNASLYTLTGATLAELARVVDGWIDERQALDERRQRR